MSLLKTDLRDLLARKKPDTDGSDDSDPSADAGPRNGSPVRIGQPRVDLLPEAHRQRVRARAMRRRTIAVAAGTGVVVAGAWGTTLYVNGAAQDRFDQAKALEQTLSADMAVYSPVSNLATQTQSLTGTIEVQESTSVDHDVVLDRFLAAAAGRIDVASVHVDTSGPGSCVSTDPFAAQTELVGRVTFSGSPLDVPGLLSGLSADDWFQDPYVPTVGDGTSLAGTVGLTAQVRTHAAEDASADPGAGDPQTTEPLEPTPGEQDGDQG